MEVTRVAGAPGGATVFLKRFEPALTSSERRWNALLPETELATASSILDPAMKERYLQSRVLLRTVLARILGVEARAVSLTTGSSGKPVLSPRMPRRVHFSLSRCARAGVVAVSPTDVGIDIENVRPVPRRVVDRLLIRSERRELDALSDEGRATSFFKYWVVKESCAKALDAGRVPFWRVPSTLAEHGRAGAVTWHRLDVGDDLAAAVAVRDDEGAR